MIPQFHSFTLTGRMLNWHAGFYDPVCPCVSSDRERIGIVYASIHELRSFTCPLKASPLGESTSSARGNKSAAASAGAC